MEADHTDTFWWKRTPHQHTGAQEPNYQCHTELAFSNAKLACNRHTTENN